MKKIYLLLILSLLSVQSFAASCPDGSDPVKSISDDGTFFVYKCGGNNDNKTKTANQTSTDSDKSSSSKNKTSPVDSNIVIYDVIFSSTVLNELLGRVVSKTDYDFSKHNLAKNINKHNCSFSLSRVVYDQSTLGIIEGWSMAKGNINIKGSDVEFAKSNWSQNMGGLSNDPSYFRDKVNLKLTEGGHFVGKMAYFTHTVKQGEAPMNPLYVTLTKHKRSEPLNLKNIAKSYKAGTIWIDVEDWAGGVMTITNCKEGNI
jgi:hypothetical protein